MVCIQLNEGEEFHCAGNLYRMLIPRDATGCLESALEVVAPGGATPPNAHKNFVQIYSIFSGTARVYIGESCRDVSAPAVAFIPQMTKHWVENIGEQPLEYVYTSIWPGQMPSEEKVGWREASQRMVLEYAERGFPPQSETK
jgi:mannose-6-phosphate isomerase-like protein (cupin superfamily)